MSPPDPTADTAPSPMHTPLYPATNAIFHDPALLDAEQERLFANGWILVGTVDQLPGPDTHFVRARSSRATACSPTSPS